MITQIKDTYLLKYQADICYICRIGAKSCGKQYNKRASVYKDAGLGMHPFLS